MISYIVGRNLGHLNRCVANVSKFKKISNNGIKIYAYPHSHSWIRSNLRKVKIGTHDRKKLKKMGPSLLKSDLIIHDWREEVQQLKDMRHKQKCIISGIYHSDLQITREDTDWTRKFKEQVRDISQKTTDIFFHINLTQPKDIPKLSTLYVPIPIIVREHTMKPERIKKILGIPQKEPFILVQMGGGIGKFRYKYMNEWYEKINKLRTPYRIVIANQFGKRDFKFGKHIIQAPLFDNGRDLVNASEMVISKPGMGILVDCISTGTPLLALPADSKEREVKNLMLRDLVGSDVCLASKKFSSKDLSKRIKEVNDEENKFQKSFKNIPQNGADVMAKSIKLLSKHSLKELPGLYHKVLKLTPFKA